MKTIFCVVSLIASLEVARAHDIRWDCSPAYYQAAVAAYLTPVVYQAMAVYQGPVVYYGPVYYVTPPASFGCAYGYDRWCRPRSTVIGFGAGRVYSYSNCGQYPWESTVVFIGSRYARPH